MGITRAQIARQLLAEGGMSLNDAKAMAPEGEFLAYINPKEADMLKAAGWASPAKHTRGNIFDDNQDYFRWTGPNYM